MKRSLKEIVRNCTALVITAILVTGTCSSAAVIGVGAFAAPSRPSAAGKAPEGESGAKAVPIDINAADVEKLTELPGIGMAIAKRIVDYRKEHGPFKSVDELQNVRGIGERLVQRLRDRITVGTKS